MREQAIERSELAASADYRRRLVEHSSSMLAYWGADLRCRFANQAYRHWFGVDPDRLVGTSLQELLGSELFALNEPYIRAVLRGEEQLFERSVPGPGGVVRESLANYVPDVVDGNVVGFLVQVTDITRVKATQAALKETEEYLRELFALSHEGILVTDVDGRYTDVNDSCCAMLGYERSEIVGCTFERLLDPSELVRLPGARAEMIAGARHVEEWLLRRKDGTSVPVELHAKVLSDGRRVGFLLDISDHRRLLAAERATAQELEENVAARTEELRRMANELKISEARLRGIFDAASDGIITADEHQVIVEANLAAARMFQTTVDAMLGTPLERYIPQRHRQAHRSSVRDFGRGAVAARAMGGRQVTALRADGLEFPIEASISHVTIGSHQLFTVIHRDITQRVQMLGALEIAHRQLQDLVTAMDRVAEEERKRIAREMHDDLQQTLAAIKMNVAALAEARPASAAGDHALLGEIARLADTAVESTRRIIADLRPMMIDELGFVPALVALAGQTGRRHGFECDVVVAPAGDPDSPFAPAIATCLFRVTQEALNNVVRHAGATRVEITLDGAAGHEIVLRIRDDGVGLVDADMRKSGSFGLLGMRERVRALGGVVHVSGGPGGGTLVEVRLPASPADAAGLQGARA